MPYAPILAEMHAIKDAISAEFNHDIDELLIIYVSKNVNPWLLADSLSSCPHDR